MSKPTNDWGPLLEDQFQQPYYKKLREFLAVEYRTHTVYPAMDELFNALHYTPYEQVKVVILGQDPYHGPGQAHGLSFSVKPGVKPPPSLQNMFKELRDDLGLAIPDHGCLTPWAAQGVLLLNNVLSVRKGEANSHHGHGWELFTDRIIELLNERDIPVVFLLWGKHAQDKAARITGGHHIILKAPHPSPFSANRGFFGSRPYSRANEALVLLGLEPIDWQLPRLGDLKFG